MDRKDLECLSILLHIDYVISFVEMPFLERYHITLRNALIFDN